jgi:hypothetical protein
MNRRLLLPLLAAALALAQLSCAAAGLQPVHDSMPAARAALRPEFRVFYDALEEDGEWVLIEPYGYVFRPRVAFASWRPYQNGFWVPSDVYGWVWVSAERFGWITFHYGDWMWDRFQGWVWIPGLDWGPAWVSWAQDGDYIGWAPLMPGDFDYSQVPGGAYNYVRAGQLPATNLSSQVVTAEKLGARAAEQKSIVNMKEQDGVSFNLGPRIEAIERVAGPLERVKLQGLTSPEAPATVGRREAGGSRPREADGVANTRRAAIEAAREAKRIADEGASAPPSVEVLRPAPAKEEPPATPREPRRGRGERPKREGGAAPARADSAR